MPKKKKPVKPIQQSEALPDSMPKRYQIVEILLTNGRIVTFIGPEQILPEDVGMRAVGIRFHTGQDIPDDCHFESLTKLHADVHTA
jgi:hypothetical protein